MSRSRLLCQLPTPESGLLACCCDSSSGASAVCMLQLSGRRHLNWRHCLPSCCAVWCVWWRSPESHLRPVCHHAALLSTVWFMPAEAGRPTLPSRGYKLTVFFCCLQPSGRQLLRGSWRSTRSVSMPFLLFFLLVCWRAHSAALCHLPPLLLCCHVCTVVCLEHVLLQCQQTCCQHILCLLQTLTSSPKRRSRTSLWCTTGPCWWQIPGGVSPRSSVAQAPVRVSRSPTVRQAVVLCSMEHAHFRASPAAALAASIF